MSYGRQFVLTLFTNDPALATAAAQGGVDRMGVDMERVGKSPRQAHLATWIADHAETGPARIRPTLQSAQRFARCNPVHAGLGVEIARLVGAGVGAIMLPYFKTAAAA